MRSHVNNYNSIKFMGLRERIERHEGRRRWPYRDTEGFLTVGVGRCIDKQPFSHDEINLMLSNDIERAIRGASAIPVYEFLDPARREILTEMVFQLGPYGVSRFKKFLAAARRKDWQVAHDEMLDSLWARQTPRRAKELAEAFRDGRFQ